ncbi:MAG: alanine--tRNA ligase [Gammaproteobacteria bacterium]
MIDTTYNGLRQAFLEFFQNKGHTIVPSSPLIPGNDPTLLFTNAGMVQFKEAFLGLDKRGYVRATSAQRCVRAGGKHNDLDNVGYTARHHTFFEMLGNFSFGDYFKREAIQYAWEFLTHVLELPPEKLWITVYQDDHEAADIWLKEIGVDPTRLSRCGEKDNFWSMGDTGPCGPCSEIFYDHGPTIPGGPPGSPEADADRYIEIWNLVFMQFERHADGSMDPLPKPSVDTGMGLERIAAVMQGMHDNYDTDLFQHLIKAIATLAKTNDLTQKSLRVIADHIRSSAFLIMDGVIPSNEGRGYVLRRIIRRAARHGNHVGLHVPFLYQLVQPLSELMPELQKTQDYIARLLKQEEEQFAKTLDNGLKILEEAIREVSSQGVKERIISGNTVFRLYDTYGFPVDLTADIARERGLAIDLVGFEKEMAKQRQQSQNANQFIMQRHTGLALDLNTEFTGYEYLEHQANVIELFSDDNPVSELKTGQNGMVILDRTPFYAESGGQIGDRGQLTWPHGEFIVTDTLKDGNAYVHYGHVTQGILKKQPIWTHVDSSRRNAVRSNHTATHLLHAALKQKLGPHVQQKGSLVEPERLRFDFTHPQPITPSEIQGIEYIINQQIRTNICVDTILMPTEQAMKSGAVALFGEKYGEEVRVLKMGEVSTELCGGTHTSRTGDIGIFKITAETGIAAGIRRIEAVTGESALQWLDNQKRDLSEQINQLIEKNKLIEQQVTQLQKKLAAGEGHKLAQKAQLIGDTSLLIETLPSTDIKHLREMLDALKNKLPNSVIVLASISNGRVTVISGVTKDQIKNISAETIVKKIAEHIGGKGGGKSDMAQAGSGDPEKLQEALKTVEDLIKKSL